MSSRDFDQPKTAVSTVRKATTMSRGCLVLFFSVFFLAGCGFFVLFFVIPIYGVLRARSWVETPCTIVSSEVKTHHDDEGETYSIYIVYNYTFDGRQYQSERYDFAMGSSSGYKGKKRIVDQHPPGSQHVCYVDPNNPKEAVINRSFRGEFLIGLFPLIFVAVGGIGMMWGLGVIGKRSRKPKPSTWQPQSVASLSDEAIDDDRDDFLPDYEGDIPSGPVTLKAEYSPVVKFIGALIFTLFWNGIVSVFVWQVVDSHINGRPEWFLTLFMIPFVLVGLGGVGFVGHSFLAIFNPRSVLTVDSAAAALGETIRVQWLLSGNVTSVRQLHIYLHGQEESKYRRGTSTYTDQETFAKLTIVDTTNPASIMQGEEDLTIPADSMHSFEANNNKINWSIEVHGEIGWWPDIKDSYPYVVLPHRKVR